MKIFSITKYAFLLSLAAFLMLMPVCLLLARLERPAITAYLLDVSGSMRHCFGDVKEAVTGDMKGLKEGSTCYIIPFAENERKILRVKHDDTIPPAFSAVESFIRSLSADGMRTHLDEGLDAAKVALMEEPGEAVRSIILISDGISDPDSYHNEMDLDELSRRIPESFSLYFIDMSNGSYPGLPEGRFEGFRSFCQPGGHLNIFPLANPGRLTELLSVINQQIEKDRQIISEAAGESAKVERSFHLSLHATFLILTFALAALLLFLVLRRRAKRRRQPLLENAEEDTPEDGVEGNVKESAGGRNGMLCVKVGDTEKRFSIPVKLTIGGSVKDDILVKGARRRELSIFASADGRQVFNHRKGLLIRDRGSIFRSRSFALSNGTPVTIKLEREEASIHRYLKKGVREP